MTLKSRLDVTQGHGTIRKLGTISYLHFIATISVSLAVSEIFSVKEWRNLEIWI